MFKREVTQWTTATTAEAVISENVRQGCCFLREMILPFQFVLILSAVVFQDVQKGNDSKDNGTSGHLLKCQAGVFFSAEAVFVGPALRYFTSSNFNFTPPLLCIRLQQLSRQKCIFENRPGGNKRIV